MIGNGPYMLDEPRTDQEIVLVPQRRAGPATSTATPRPTARQDHLPDRRADPDTAYNAFEAGEGDNGQHPAGPRRGGRRELRHHARRRRSSASYHFEFNGRPGRRRPRERPAPPGDLAGHRPRRDQRGRLRRQPDHGHRHHARRASRASTTDLCDYCAYDPEAAQAAFDEWTAAGNELDRADPDPVQRRRRPRARRRRSSSTTSPPSASRPWPSRSPTRRTSPSSPTAPASSAGRLVRRLPDVRQLHVRPVPHRRHRRQQPRLLHRTPSSTPWSTRPRQTIDPDEQGELFQEAEEILLNEDIGVIPINWYRGDYVYNHGHDRQLPADPARAILWEQVTVTANPTVAPAGPVAGARRGGRPRACPRPRTPRATDHDELHHPPAAARSSRRSSSRCRSCSSCSSCCPATRPS